MLLDRLKSSHLLSLIFLAIMAIVILSIFTRVNNKRFTEEKQRAIHSLDMYVNTIDGYSINVNIEDIPVFADIIANRKPGDSHLQMGGGEAGFFCSFSRHGKHFMPNYY